MCLDGRELLAVGLDVADGVVLVLWAAPLVILSLL